MIKVPVITQLHPPIVLQFSWYKVTVVMHCLLFITLHPSSAVSLLHPLSLSHTHVQMEEIGKKLAPILQIGDSHLSDSEEDKMADSGETPTSDTIVAAPLVQVL